MGTWPPSTTILSFLLCPIQQVKLSALLNRLMFTPKAELSLHQDLHSRNMKVLERPTSRDKETMPTFSQGFPLVSSVQEFITSPMRCSSPLLKVSLRWSPMPTSAWADSILHSRTSVRSVLRLP